MKYMTIRQFRNKYGIKPNQRFRDACSLTIRPMGWRGLRSKVCFVGNEYAYPENVLKKIVTILGCTKEHPIEVEKEMTITKFKKLVPDLSINFAAAVAHTAQIAGIENKKHPYEYPLKILIHHAKREGKEIPQMLLNYEKTEEQTSEQQERQSNETTNDLLREVIRKIEENNRLQEENNRLQEEGNRLQTALLAVWKGEQS